MFNYKFNLNKYNTKRVMLQTAYVSYFLLIRFILGIYIIIYLKYNTTKDKDNITNYLTLSSLSGLYLPFHEKFVTFQTAMFMIFLKFIYEYSHLPIPILIYVCLDVFILFLYNTIYNYKVITEERRKKKERPLLVNINNDDSINL